MKSRTRVLPIKHEPPSPRLGIGLKEIPSIGLFLRLNSKSLLTSMKHNFEFNSFMTEAVIV